MGTLAQNGITLIHGDCLEQMQTLAPQSVDMVLCDLPYGTTRCKWDSVIPLEPLWGEYMRVTSAKNLVVLTSAQPFTSHLVVSSPVSFKYDWVWSKVRVTGHLNAKKMPLREHESVLVFYDSLPTYNPQMMQGAPHTRGPRGKPAATQVYGEFLDDNSRSYISSEYYPTSIVEFRSEMQPVHPTQKPVALMEYLIRTYTNPGDTVLDNCMGSGTTGVACARTGRRFIGIEKDEKYFNIAQERIQSEFAAKS